MAHQPSRAARPNAYVKETDLPGWSSQGKRLNAMRIVAATVLSLTRTL
jgi:hypothetical protein